MSGAYDALGLVKRGVLFHEDYRGRRWRYGCRFRPPAYAAVPEGEIIGARVGAPGLFLAYGAEQGSEWRRAYPHGFTEYPRPLTLREMRAHELRPLPLFRCDFGAWHVIAAALLGLAGAAIAERGDEGCMDVLELLSCTSTAEIQGGLSRLGWTLP